MFIKILFNYQGELLGQRNPGPSAKDLFYPFLATQQNHTNIECSVYLNVQSLLFIMIIYELLLLVN